MRLSSVPAAFMVFVKSAEPLSTLNVFVFCLMPPAVCAVPVIPMVCEQSLGRSCLLELKELIVEEIHWL